MQLIENSNIYKIGMLSATAAMATKLVSRNKKCFRREILGKMLVVSTVELIRSCTKPYYSNELNSKRDKL